MQLMRQNDLLARGYARLAQPLNEACRRRGPQFAGRLHDGRQGHGPGRHPGSIIEAYHRDVVGHAQAARMQRPQGTHGQPIVPREERLNNPLGAA